jgi:HlyD family secretion protein
MTPDARPRRAITTACIAAGALAVASAAYLFGRSPGAQHGPQTPEVPYARDAEGVVCFGIVDLEQGVTSLSTLQAGRVASVLVQENQSVSAGQELLRLEDGMLRSRLAEADAALELARAQWKRASKLPDQHRKRVDQQKAVLDAQRARLATARELLAQRQEKLKLRESAAATAIEVSAAELQVRELEALERADAERLAVLEGEEVDGGIQRAVFELRAAQARREQAVWALAECSLKAPQAGSVLRVLVRPGDVLGAPASSAILFAANGPQVIRAAVEQEFVPRIKQGQAVVVADESDTSRQWRGRVERLAGWYSQRRTVMQDPAQMSDVRTLECVIVLDPEQPRLRLGQSVRVFVGTAPGPP